MECGLTAGFYFLPVLFWAVYVYSETDNHHKYQEAPRAKLSLGALAHILRSRSA